MSILLATHNPAKISRFKKYSQYSSFLVEPFDLNLDKVKAEEIGKDEKENAKIKALAYYKASQINSVSLDTGFYFEGYPEDKQPAKNAQRVAGVTDNDSDDQRYQKMVSYYTKEANKNGGQIKGYFRDVFCCYNGQNTFFAEAIRPVVVTNKINKKDVHLPIASVYIIPSNNKYYHDLTEDEIYEFVRPSVEVFDKLIIDSKLLYFG